jgi:hypothetical protein
MQWIFDHFQLVILAVLGIGSLVKTVLESRARQKREYGPPPGDSEPYAGAPLEKDTSYRKVPRQSGPPALPRATVPPALRESGYDAAVANETAKALKHQQDLAERLRLIRETKATTSGGAAATRARIASKVTKKDSRQSPLQSASLRERLRDRSEIRRAFVMREILDPPVGLR